MKRYPAYKDSDIEWVGEIPDRWSSKPLFALFKERQVPNEGNKETNVLSLSYGRIIRRDTESNFGLLPESFETYNIVEPLDIVLRLTDLQNDKRSLRCGLVQEKGIITSAYLTLEKKAEVDSKYMYYLLHNYDIWKVFYSMGGGVRQAIKFDDLKRLPILFPSLDEQRSIVSYLDCKTVQIDDLISKKEEMIQLLKEERIAIINQAVTKGIDPKVEMKDSGIECLGDIPAHWELKRLKYVAYINPPRPDSIAEESSVVFIAMESMNNDGTYDNSVMRQYSEVKTGFTCFAEDDVIFAKITPCFENGKGALLRNLGTGIGFGSTEFHVLRSIKDITTPNYLYFLTMSGLFRRLGEAFMQGVAGQKRVTSDFVRNFIIGVPPINEQKAISAFLSANLSKIDTQIGREQRSIELLREYRTSLISEVVTGKIDVREKTA